MRRRIKPGQGLVFNRIKPGRSLVCNGRKPGQGLVADNGKPGQGLVLPLVTENGTAIATRALVPPSNQTEIYRYQDTLRAFDRMVAKGLPEFFRGLLPIQHSRLVNRSKSPSSHSQTTITRQPLFLSFWRTKRSLSTFPSNFLRQKSGLVLGT